MKIQFDHTQDLVTVGIGLPEEKVDKLSDMVWDEIASPTIDLMYEKLPDTLESIKPEEYEEKLDDELNKFMPSVLEVIEKIQDIAIDNGFEANVALGYIVHELSNKVIDTLTAKVKSGMALHAMGQLRQTIEENKAQEKA